MTVDVCLFARAAGLRTAGPLRPAASTATEKESRMTDKDQENAKGHERNSDEAAQEARRRFARAMARSELGRHYWTDSMVRDMRQTSKTGRRRR
jgi:hypothetical protein